MREENIRKANIARNLTSLVLGEKNEDLIGLIFAGKRSIKTNISSVLRETNEGSFQSSLEAAFCGYLNKDGSKRRKTIRLHRFCVWLDSERVGFFSGGKLCNGLTGFEQD